MEEKKGKLVIFSAPSGSGKTTIVRLLLDKNELNLEFSISACTRPKRNNEEEGKDYYFMPHETFMEKVRNGEFVEWEEVYKDHYYGTLKKEVERIRNKGTNVIFDIDVLGGLNLKRFYGKAALAIFVMPPSLEELSKRLINRSLDEDEKIRMRIEKAESELQYAHKFDCILYNNELDEAVDKAYKLVKNFLQK